VPASISDPAGDGFRKFTVSQSHGAAAPVMTNLLPAVWIPACIRCAPSDMGVPAGGHLVRLLCHFARCCQCIAGLLAELSQAVSTIMSLWSTPESAPHGSQADSSSIAARPAAPAAPASTAGTLDALPPAMQTDEQRSSAAKSGKAAAAARPQPSGFIIPKRAPPPPPPGLLFFASVLWHPN
jgi:hypothetical protein